MVGIRLGMVSMLTKLFTSKLPRVEMEVGSISRYRKLESVESENFGLIVHGCLLLSVRLNYVQALKVVV